MRRKTALLLMAGLTLVISGCGASKVSKNAVANEKAPGKSASSLATPQPERQAGTPTQGNAVSIPANTGSPVESTAADSTPVDSAPINSTVKDKREGPRMVRTARGDRIDVDPSATPLPKKFQAAGENSQYALSMEQDGSVMETRVFTGHPRLAKVEMTWVDATMRAVRATFTDGEVLEVRTEALPELKTVSTARILEILKTSAKTSGDDRPRVIPRR